MDAMKLVNELPPAPAGVRDWILKDVVRNTYMIYSTKKDSATCTRCKSVFSPSLGDLFPLPKHNEDVTCPKCHSKAIYKSEGVGRQRLEERTRVLVFVKRGKSVYASLTEVNIGFTEILPKVYARLVGVYKFSAKECLSVRFCGYPYTTWKFFSNIKIPADQGSYMIQSKRVGLHLYPLNFNTVFKGTDLKYQSVPAFAARCNYNGYKIVEYLVLALKYKSVELLYKAGFDSYIYEYLMHGISYRAFNWRGKDLRHILGLNMAQIREVRGSKLPLEGLALYRSEIRAGRYKPVNQIVLMVGSGAYFARESLVPIVAPYTTIDAIVSYLAGQNVAFGCDNRLMDYLDYIRDCLTLGLDLRRRRVLFPEDFAGEHRRVSELIITLADRKKNRNISSAGITLSGLRAPYEADGLLIRPAASAAELRAESAALHHCVRNYADRMALMETCVLFVRHSETPEEPFFTVELSCGRVLQLRGERNCSPPEWVLEFVDKWHREVFLPYIKSEEQKKKRIKNKEKRVG